MKDIHCHLLPGIDDGAKTLEESIATLKRAQAEGVTDIIITPHYINKSEYNCNNKKKLELFKKLKQQAMLEEISINLYLGNEIYIDENIAKLIKNNEIRPLNNTKYLLIELPLENTMKNVKDILYELITKGYVPILAHPERYRIFKNHPDCVVEFLRMGVLLQGNYRSLFGSYGPEAKKTLKFLLKKGWISFLASDIHHEENYGIEKMKKKLKTIVHSDKIVDDLLANNFDKVINNCDIGIKG